MTAPPPMRILREPLVAFFGIGVLLFALDAVVSHGPGETVEREEVTRRLVIDEGVRRALRDAYVHENGAEPTEEELEDRVAAYVDQEILYREGLARRLDEGDERVRARVITLMADLLAAEQAAAEPTEAEVRAYFDADPTRWSEPSRIDFVHVFVAEAPDARARAEAFLAALEGGAAPARMGDSFSGGRHYRGRRIEDLESAFGEAFAEGVATQAVGAWALHPSRFGWHVVRVEQRTAGSDADFERARADVTRALSIERRDARAREATLALRARWSIEGAE